ncbi:hypothetical protein HYH03_006071 [Edaphochlamys debaryana]|uniref:N-acetyltransferase domain-containing protein n=1 Tax=Edaphochlamys debaryana TaxID=47281 RepID=A0A835Y669_9CHLO|nr:hypothetical protein HYH03_006071 [Edaphochlamys debaryana]|eukprot:KAG2495832.1 hypothetical protein HYH03_006071 [Edaphochlamys debaryana]
MKKSPAPEPLGGTLRLRHYRPEDKEAVHAIFAQMVGNARAGVPFLLERSTALQVASVATPLACVLLAPRGKTTTSTLAIKAAALGVGAAVVPFTLYFLVRRLYRDYVVKNLAGEDLANIEAFYSAQGAGSGSAFWVAELVPYGYQPLSRVASSAAMAARANGLSRAPSSASLPATAAVAAGATEITAASGKSSVPAAPTPAPSMREGGSAEASVVPAPPVAAAPAALSSVAEVVAPGAAAAAVPEAAAAVAAAEPAAGPAEAAAEAEASPAEAVASAVVEADGSQGQAKKSKKKKKKGNGGAAAAKQDAAASGSATPPDASAPELTAPEASPAPAEPAAAEPAANGHVGPSAAAAAAPNGDGSQASGLVASAVARLEAAARSTGPSLDAPAPSHKPMGPAGVIVVSGRASPTSGSPTAASTEVAAAPAAPPAAAPEPAAAPTVPAAAARQTSTLAALVDSATGLVTSLGSAVSGLAAAVANLGGSGLPTPPPRAPGPVTKPVIVGHVALERKSWQVAELRRMAVHPDYRRYGIAALLTDGLVRHARDVGFRELVLSTTNMQQAACRLYESKGWVLEKQTPMDMVQINHYRLDLIKKK